MQDRRLAGGSAVSVPIDQQVLIEAEQRVVERGVVGADLDTGQVDNVAQVAAMELDTSFESACGAFLLGAEPDCGGGLIAEQESELDTLPGLLPDGCGEVELLE